MKKTELLSMIKEEFESYMREEEGMDVAVVDDAGMDDLAVDGEEVFGDEAAAGPEDTLRAIFDQLAAYFEEMPDEEGFGDEEDLGDLEDLGGEEEIEEAKEEVEENAAATQALQERFKKLANIIK